MARKLADRAAPAQKAKADAFVSEAPKEKPDGELARDIKVAKTYYLKRTTAERVRVEAFKRKVNPNAIIEAALDAYLPPVGSEE